MMLTEKEYSETIDAYMDKGTLPNSYQQDLICLYVKETLDDKKNKERWQSDSMSRQLLKESLMDFIKYLLSIFSKIEEECKERQEQLNQLMVAGGENDGAGDVENLFGSLREMMAGVEGHVNLDGYQKMIETGAGNGDLIREMIEKDCGQACREYYTRQEEQFMKMLSRNDGSGRKGISMHGDADAEMVDNWLMEAGKYPEIEEIAQIMGREMLSDDDEEEVVPVSHYMPQLLSPSKIHTEIDGITIGDDIPLTLPSEIAQLADPEAEWLFYQKFASAKLQLFSCKPPAENVDKSSDEVQRHPRPDKGPVIVAIDTSGSMDGKPEHIAKAMLVQLVELAHAQHRKCFLVSWSVQAKSLELTQEGAWSELKAFLNNQFTGGNDESMMLQAVFKALDSDDFGMADVLMISDFIISPPTRAQQEQIEAAQEDGTRFYGLQIGTSFDMGEMGIGNSYEDSFDRIWKHAL